MANGQGCAGVEGIIFIGIYPPDIGKIEIDAGAPLVDYFKKWKPTTISGNSLGMFLITGLDILRAAESWPSSLFGIHGGKNP